MHGRRAEASIAVPFVFLPAVVELVVGGHDNEFASAIYLDPAPPHVGSLRSTECPRHVLLPEYGRRSSHDYREACLWVIGDRPGCLQPARAPACSNRSRQSARPAIGLARASA